MKLRRPIIGKGKRLKLVSCVATRGNIIIKRGRPVEYNTNRLLYSQKDKLKKLFFYVSLSHYNVIGYKLKINCTIGKYRDIIIV